MTRTLTISPVDGIQIASDDDDFEKLLKYAKKAKTILFGSQKTWIDTIKRWLKK